MTERIADDWLQKDETQAVFSALEARGFVAFAVGGCVRNSLIGAPVSDIDLSTDAHPDAMAAAATAAGLRAIPTGEDHGTLTILSGDTAYEVTTFRKDVDTDGRHAKVVFADNLEDDAHRRDFTMNALYCDRRGMLIDPLGGVHDLKARRVRFIDDADARIREDFLRILRYFRFHAYYGGDAVDEEAIAAIAANVDGLARISRERIGAETLKLLSAPDPAPSVAAMEACGVLTAILPGADATALAPLVHLESEAGVAPDAMRRLAALGGEGLPEGLRLSNAHADALSAIRSAALGGDAPQNLGYHLGLERARDAILVRAAFLSQPVRHEDLDAARKGAAANFPISAHDLMPDLTGKALGDRLRTLERRWIDSDFTLTKAELLSG